MRRFLNSFCGLSVLSLFFVVVFLYPTFVDAARESSRSSARSASTRTPKAGTRDIGHRPESMGRSTFTKDDLNVLCGRYFEECTKSYMPKRRKFKDPKCQELMPQCFHKFGPSVQQCQDTVYTCLDQICQPRAQCTDKSRVKEMALACLEKGDKYYPYVCSARSFKSVVSQILTEAGGAALAMQTPKTIVRNEISPEMKARMEAQERALAEQQAMLERQQVALAEAEAERERMAAEEEEEEDNAGVGDEDPLWTELENCQDLLKKSESALQESTEYAGCSPTIPPIFKQQQATGFSNDDFRGAKKVKKNDSDTDWDNPIPECTKKGRLKALRYRLNDTLKSLKKVRKCAGEMNKKASKAKMSSDYTRMIRRKLGQMDVGATSTSISKLNIDDFISESKGTYKKEEKHNLDKNKDYDQDDFRLAIDFALYDTKLLYKMNEIVLEDFENMLSGVQLDAGGSGQTACQGLFGPAVNQCVMSTATQYYNELMRGADLSSMAGKVKSLALNSAYIFSDTNGKKTPCAHLMEGDTSENTVQSCIQELRSKAQQNQMQQRRPYY